MHDTAMTFKIEGRPALIAKHENATVTIFREDMAVDFPKVFDADDFEALCRWFLARRGLSVRRDSRKNFPKERRP